MSQEQLKEYVAHSLAQGMKPEEVRAALLSQGWSGIDIDQALGVPGAAMPSIHGDAVGHRKWPVVVGVLAAALLFGAGGAFAYVKFFAQTPDRRVAAAVNAALAAKSMEYAGSLRIEATIDQNDEKGAAAGGALAMVGAAGEADQPTKLLLTFDGAYDRLEPGNAKNRGSYTLATTETLGGAPLGTLETRTTGGATYLSLTRAPSLPFFDLTPITGVWIKYEPKALSQLMASASSSDETPKKSVTAEQRSSIEKALIEIRPVRVAETLKDEEVDGVPSRHYRLSVDRAKLRMFLLEVQKIMDDGASLAYEKLSDDYDKFSKQVELQTLEIWIGKTEGMPTRLLLAGSAEKSEDVPGKGAFTFDVSFKNHGKPIRIDAPAETKTLEEIFGLVMSGGGMMGASGTAEEEAIALSALERRNATQTITDVRQIQTALELAYADLGAYPIDAQPVDLGGVSRRVLCRFRSAAGWTADAADCDGAVYMDEVPLPPILGDSYSYESADGDRYALKFTLGMSVGGLPAGPLCATPEGFFTSPACAPSDADGDGLEALEEHRYGSDPAKADTDGDGFNDGDEVKNRYDPAGPGPLTTP